MKLTSTGMTPLLSITARSPLDGGADDDDVLALAGDFRVLGVVLLHVAGAAAAGGVDG